MNEIKAILHPETNLIEELTCHEDNQQQEYNDQSHVSQ
jgi:hypothetical protein